MSAIVNPSAKNYGETVLLLARREGYIESNFPVQVAQNHPYHSPHCWFWYCPMGGERRSQEEGKTWLVIAAIAAVATSLISLGYSIRAAFQASAYTLEKQEANEQLDNNPGGNSEASLCVYRNARNLLNGMAKERYWTTFSLASVTIGTALLTVVCIIALVTHPHFSALVYQMAPVGGALAGVGLISLAIVQGYFSGYRLNNDARTLRRSIDHPENPRPRTNAFSGASIRLGDAVAAQQEGAPSQGRNFPGQGVRLGDVISQQQLVASQKKPEQNPPEDTQPSAPLQSEENPGAPEVEGH